MLIILNIASANAQLGHIREMTAKYEQKMSNYTDLFKDMTEVINRKLL
jgi:hypothetical protein